VTHKTRWQSRAEGRDGRRLDEVVEREQHKRSVRRMLTVQAEAEAEDIEVRDRLGLVVR
jgi:hypothetical protein